VPARLKLAAALSASAVLLGGCGFRGLYSAPLPGGADVGDHPYSLTIQFANVLDLVPQSQVKVNDVAVGKVTDIALQDCRDPNTGSTLWCAKVKVQVNGNVHLPANASAAVQQTSLLGEKYVALIPPPSAKAAKARLANGSLIPIARTRSAPEVEQVLGALSLLLNNGGLSQIKAIATELDRALGTTGRQQAAKDLLKQLNTFVGTLDSQKDDITTALSNIDQLAKTLNDQKGVITEALDTYPQALHVLSQERGNLVRLLQNLSRLGVVATRVINATQTDFVSSLKALRPVLLQLTAAGSALPKSLRILGTFPFPLGVTRQIIKGDYANLNVTLDLNLTSQLCGLISCPATTTHGGRAGNSASEKPLTRAPGKKSTDSSSTVQLEPMLVGSGGK
jgi:phospholipid/cholesterol/gamma-HCH transport system substrate-binding protein